MITENIRLQTVERAQPRGVAKLLSLDLSKNSYKYCR